MTKKILNGTLIGLIVLPIGIVVSCKNANKIGEFQEEILNEYKEQQKTFIKKQSLSSKPNYRVSGDLLIEWNAKQERNLDSDWKTASTIRNASFYAMDDFIQAYNDKNQKNVILKSKIENSIQHQKITAGTELPDFIIVDDAGLLEFSKYEFNGKKIFNEFKSENAKIKPFTFQPLVNIIDYTMLNKVFEFQAHNKQLSTTKIFDNLGNVIDKTIDATSLPTWTINDMNKFKSFDLNASTYTSDSKSIYESSIVFNQIKELKYGVGFDFPGTTISDTLHSSKKFELTDNNFNGQEVPSILDSFEKVIGKGVNVKLAGDNNYTTSNFENQSIINVVSKGFSLNYLQSNSNLIVKGISDQNELNGRYLISFDSGNETREEEKSSFISSFFSDQIESDFLKADYNGSIVGSTTPISFDMYYSIWSKGRATYESSRDILADPLFYTSDIRMSFRLSEMDVNALISLNSAYQMESNTLQNIRNNAIFSKSIDLVSRQIMDNYND